MQVYPVKLMFITHSLVPSPQHFEDHQHSSVALPQHFQDHQSRDQVYIQQAIGTTLERLHTLYL